jgi:hemolysin activation/secretion protein
MPVQIYSTRFVLAPLAVVSLACLCGPVHAQTAAPDAGSILQGIERERKATPPATTAPALAQPQAAAASQGDATVLVKQFTVSGNSLIPETALTPVLVSYTNRLLTMAELQQAADALVQLYLDRGYLARTVLPKQDVTEGVVRIQVIESSFSGVDFDAKVDGKRITEERLRNTIAAQIQPGDPMSLKKLERGLMLADDIPGVNVTGRLVAGVNDLTTGVLLNVSDEPFTYGEAAIDNYGSRSTGPVRLTVNGTMSGAFKMGDQFSLFTMKTEGIEFGRLGFSLPAGHNGWRVGANASYMQYKVVEGLEAKGTSKVLGLDANYPIFRSRPDNLYYVANLDKKYFVNKDNQGIDQSNYNSFVFSTGLNGSTTDALAKGGLTSGNIMLSVGRINLRNDRGDAAFDAEKKATDAAAENAQGSFKKLKYATTHTQNISSDLIAFASFSGQWASKNLDSSEKFYLGGPLGVRAYPNNEGGGSEGQLLTLELRQNLPGDMVLTAFYDRGRVRVNKNDDFPQPNDNTPNKLTYQGRGLQLTWYGPKNSNLKVTWARRSGSNPYPANAGTDQDGTQKIDRYWLSASIPF